MSDRAGRTRRHAQGEKSREGILDAATALMSSNGFAGTSISDLARVSGLPASSIYWHFESKAGVLAAVMERGARRFFDEIRSTPREQSDPSERLLDLMNHSDHAVRAKPDFLRLFILLLLGSEDGNVQQAVVDRVRAEGRSHLHDALTLSYAPWGEPVATRIADELADLLFALFDGIFIAGQARLPHRQDQLIEQLVASIHFLALQIRDRPNQTARRAVQGEGRRDGGGCATTRASV